MGGQGGGGGGQLGGQGGGIFISEFDLAEVGFWLKDVDALVLLLWANKAGFKVNDDATRAIPKIVHRIAIFNLFELLLLLRLFFIKIQ